MLSLMPLIPILGVYVLRLLRRLEGRSWLADGHMRDEALVGVGRIVGGKWWSANQLVHAVRHGTYQDDQAPSIIRPNHIQVLPPPLQTFIRPQSYSLNHGWLYISSDRRRVGLGLTRTSHTAIVSLVNETKKLPLLLGRMA
jgi:hypothetical protein